MALNYYLGKDVRTNGKSHLDLLFRKHLLCSWVFVRSLCGCAYVCVVVCVYVSVFPYMCVCVFQQLFIQHLCKVGKCFRWRKTEIVACIVFRVVGRWLGWWLPWGGCAVNVIMNFSSFAATAAAFSSQRFLDKRRANRIKLVHKKLNLKKSYLIFFPFNFLFFRFCSFVFPHYLSLFGSLFIYIFCPPLSLLFRPSHRNNCHWNLMSFCPRAQIAFPQMKMPHLSRGEFIFEFIIFMFLLLSFPFVFYWLLFHIFTWARQKLFCPKFGALTTWEFQMERKKLERTRKTWSDCLSFNNFECLYVGLCLEWQYIATYWEGQSVANFLVYIRLMFDIYLIYNLTEFSTKLLEYLLCACMQSILVFLSSLYSQ